MSAETTYEIRVWDVLDDKWKTYFTPFTLEIVADETILTGLVHDQAELFGVLLKIRDLGLWLVSVNPISRE
jgi:phosphopantothenoylcysteine synthetase/decarboxylase